METCVFGSGRLDSNIYQAIFGESIPSLRPLVKRFVPTLIVQPSTTVTAIAQVGFLNIYFPLYPMIKAASDFQWWAQGGTNSGSNLVLQTPFGLLASGHVGVRGGYRYKVIDVGAFLGENESSVGTLSTSVGPNHPTFTTLCYQQNINQTIPPTRYGVLRSNDAMNSSICGLVGDMINGGDYTISRDGVLAQIEIPSKSPDYFVLPRYSSDTTTPGPLGFRLGTVMANTTFQNHFLLLGAAAEDTQFVFWRGMPAMLASGYVATTTGTSVMP